MSKQQSQCVGCVHAEWRKTESGRLSPSGDGRCQWVLPYTPIPVAMYYGCSSHNRHVPLPSGGWITPKADQYPGNAGSCPTRKAAA